MKDDYPKVQWSKFKGASREEQWVLRGDSIVDVMDLKAELESKLAETETIDDVLDEEADSQRVCKVCGKQLSLREGVSAKTNKPWKGWFCQDKTHAPEWEK